MKNLFLTLALATVAGSAFAVTAQSGFYITGLGGISYSKTPDPATLASPRTQTNVGDITTPYYDEEKNVGSFGGTIGYDYAFNSNVMTGFEVSYLDLIRTNNTFNGIIRVSEFVYIPYTEDINIKNSGVQALLTSTYLISNGLNFFVKGGAIYERTSENITTNTTDQNFTQQNGLVGPTIQTVTKWIPAAAIGIGYMPTQHINIALQYEHTFGTSYTTWSDHFTKPSTVDILTLGLTYKF